MKIGIIGAGRIGYNVAKILAPNHEIKLAASKLNEALEVKAASIGVKAVDVREAVKDVNVILLSIPVKAITELPKNLFDCVPPEVVIADTGNYGPFRDGHIEELDNGKVESVWVSEQIGRPIIKAFNNILEETLVEDGKPEGDLDRLAISVAGDSKKDKAIISRLINETGFDVVDAGNLAESWRQQPGSPAYCTELNSSELKEALAAAVKEHVPVNRDKVIADFQKKNFILTKEDKVEGNRAVQSKYPKTKNNYMQLDPVLQKMIEQLPVPKSDVLDVAALRASAEQAAPMWVGPNGPIPVASIENRELQSPEGPIRIRIYRPDGQVKGTMLHFYGGAFTLGSIDMIDPFARRFARDLSMAVVTSNYRLAPEEPFPAAYNDALFTARWVLDHAGELGGKDLPVVLSGESAGGNLVAGATLALRSEPAKKGVAAQLLINPGLDLRPSSADYPSRRADADPLLNGKLLDQIYKNYAGDHDRSDPRISPVAARDLTGLPPAVIAVPTVDPLHDEGVAYAERLREAQVQVDLIEFDNLTHGFYQMTAILPAADRAVEEMLKRLQRLLADA